jgi:hypothetical protein
MPMRFQHQMQETLKECLPRKGKYLLSIVTHQMNEQLRVRMFNDLKNHDMQERCLSVIRELKIDAEILTV